jgi:hypothetical protein
MICSNTCCNCDDSEVIKYDEELSEKQKGYYIFGRGFTAYRNGEKLNECPYNIVDYIQYSTWSEGWIAACSLHEHDNYDISEKFPDEFKKTFHPYGEGLTFEEQRFLRRRKYIRYKK